MKVVIESWEPFLRNTWLDGIFQNVHLLLLDRGTFFVSPRNEVHSIPPILDSHLPV